MHRTKSPEEKIFDQVACFLYNRTLDQARKEFYLHLFAEWSKENLDIVLKALSKEKSEIENIYD